MYHSGTTISTPQLLAGGVAKGTSHSSAEDQVRGVAESVCTLQP